MSLRIMGRENKTTGLQRVSFVYTEREWVDVNTCQGVYIGLYTYKLIIGHKDRRY